jgi:hypothetical protein
MIPLDVDRPDSQDRTCGLPKHRCSHKLLGLLPSRRPTRFAVEHCTQHLMEQSTRSFSSNTLQESDGTA